MNWIVDEKNLDSLSREEKRAIMRAIGVKVILYPVNSDYARNHHERWEFKVPEDVLLSHGSGCR